jgi:hypothetical protein
MLAAILDLDPNFRPTPVQAVEPSDSIDEEMLRITMGEYLRRPEKMIRLGVRTIRDLARASQSGGCTRWPT